MAGTLTTVCEDNARNVMLVALDRFCTLMAFEVPQANCEVGRAGHETAPLLRWAGPRLEGCFGRKHARYSVKLSFVLLISCFQGSNSLHTDLRVECDVLHGVLVAHHDRFFQHPALCVPDLDGSVLARGSNHADGGVELDTCDLRWWGGKTCSIIRELPDSIISVLLRGVTFSNRV